MNVRNILYFSPMLRKYLWSLSACIILSERLRARSKAISMGSPVMMSVVMRRLFRPVHNFPMAVFDLKTHVLLS